MNRQSAALWMNRTALGLLAIAMSWAAIGFGGVRLSEFLPVAGLVLGALAAWLTGMWIDPSSRITFPPSAWIATAFTAYVAWGYSRAPVEYVARVELLHVATYLVAFVLTINLTQRKTAPQWLLFPLVGVGVLLSFYGVWQFTSRSGTVLWYTLPGSGTWRASGTFVNPNNYANFLSLLIPIALAHAVAGRVKITGRIILGYSTVMLLAGLALSFSRGGWVAAAAGMLVLVIAMLTKPKLRLLAVGIAVTVAVVGSAFLTKSYFAKRRVTEAATVTADTPLGMRLLIWQTAIAQWKTAPLTGIGPAHFDVRYREFMPATLKSRPEYAHNDYLNTLADYGLIGIGLVLAFVATVVGHVLRIWKPVWEQSDNAGSNLRFGIGTSSNRGALLLGGSAAIVGSLAHAMGDFNLHIPAIAIALLVVIGCLIGQRIDGSYTWTPGIPLKSALSLGIVALLFVGTTVLARGFREAHAINKATSGHDDFPTLLTDWKFAAAAEPMNPLTAHAVGEIQRKYSWLGEDGYQTHASNAIPWFERAIELNPFDAKSHVGAGMSLDWLKQHNDAAVHFARAVELDPHGWFTLSQAGWHEMQTNNYARAKEFFEVSLKRTPWGTTNETARAYLRIATEKLARGDEEWPPKSLLPPQPAKP